MKRFASVSTLLLRGIPIVLALAVIAPAAPARADTVDLVYDYVEAGARLDAYLGVNRYYWGNYAGDGMLHLSTSNPVGPTASLLKPTIWAYCMEIDQFTTFSTVTYDLVPLETVIGAEKKSLIQQLYASNFNYAARTDTPVFYGGAQGNFVPGEPANNPENINAIALVYAIFEVKYDYDGTLASLDLSSGNFRTGPNQSLLGPPGIVDASEDMLAGLVDPDKYFGYMPELFALTHPQHQDLIVDLRPLPEPATAGLLAVGGVLLMGRRRKQRA